MSKKGFSVRSLLITIFFVIMITGGITGYLAYHYIWSSNVSSDRPFSFIYIHTGDDYDDVMASLKNSGTIKNLSTFDWVAKRKKYNLKVRPGRYRITKGMNNEDLVNLLRSGMQEPVNVTFNNIRTKKDLASSVGKQLEADSIELLSLLDNDSVIKALGFKNETVISMFIPNTYEFYWTTDAHEFIQRMKKEYKAFWTDERKSKASAIGFSPEQVSTLASIVNQESNMTNDKPIIAGVYINRINKGMPLEADPTLKFAIGDFSIKRILNVDKQIESPYNTYKYAGLPPGPICIPDHADIDAVLNYQKHNYLYFCAREDFSGYSNFAATYEEHLVNANKYQAALNRLNIRR